MQWIYISINEYPNLIEIPNYNQLDIWSICHFIDIPIYDPINSPIYTWFSQLEGSIMEFLFHFPISANQIQDGAPPVISWFIIPLTIDISTITPSEIGVNYKPT